MEYPQFSKIPYRNTKVEVIRTKEEVGRLLTKYGIKERQWTELATGDSLRFIFASTVVDREIKLAVQFDIPEIKAMRAGKIITVDRKVVYRMLFYSLKSLLESTQYGLMKKEDLFFSYIITQLPDGTRGTMKDLVQQQNLFLPRGID